MYTYEKIYNLMFSPLATPYSILQNFKLPNYEYVKFYCKDGLSIAEMKCQCANDNDSSIFYYYFNEQDELESIKEENSGVKQIVFDRVQAISNETNKFTRERHIENAV